MSKLSSVKLTVILVWVTLGLIQRVFLKHQPKSGINLQAALSSGVITAPKLVLLSTQLAGVPTSLLTHP